MGKWHWSWCGLCDSHIIICDTCGNNSCNGCYGFLDKDRTVECPDCENCYKIQGNPTKAQLLELVEHQRNMISDFYRTHTSRDLLLKEAKKLKIVREIKKLFKEIDKDLFIRTVNEENIDLWIIDNYNNLLSDKEHIEHVADNFHYLYRDIAKSMKFKVIEGSEPKWEKSSIKYQKFIKKLVKSMALTHLPKALVG